jgi:ribonuclease Z
LSIEVHILGSSSATPVFDRHPTSQLIKILHHQYLIDCGEGTQMQLSRYNHKPNKISRIFISHLHGDHFFGLIGLVSTMSLQGRKNPLTIYAPLGLKDILSLQFKYSETILNFPLYIEVVDEASLTTILDKDDHQVECFPLSHRIPCYGYRFTRKQAAPSLIKDRLPENISVQDIIQLKQGHNLVNDEGEVTVYCKDVTQPTQEAVSYAYCSDTIYTPSLSELLKGTTLLYHESTFTKEYESRAQSTFHSTAEQAALVAKNMGVKKLLLGHFSARYKDLSPIQDEARQIFPYSFLAIEGQKFCI